MSNQQLRMQFNMGTSTHHRGERRSLVREISVAVLVLLSVIGISVAVGRIMTGSIAEWGTWIGAFIAGIAMVGSVYAIILQAKQSEVQSWSVALGRLGNLHDQAVKNPAFARFLSELPDEEGRVSVDPDDVQLTAVEKVWLGSLFLAYEQIYVATLSLSPESQRVWRIYLKNNLNRPTLRAFFVRDATNACDYHGSFWKFVTGRDPALSPNQSGESWVINPRFFENCDGIKRTRNVPRQALVARPLVRADIIGWLELYKDPIVAQQMYAAPVESEAALWQYLQNRKFYSVYLGDKFVGGFNFYDIDGTIASFGIAISSSDRGSGLGRELVRLMQDTAKEIGIRTLRADVYADNRPCISLLENTGYRRFVWYEKNL